MLVFILRMWPPRNSKEPKRKSSGTRVGQSAASTSQLTDGLELIKTYYSNRNVGIGVKKWSEHFLI
jgi:hypothetical protein